MAPKGEQRIATTTVFLPEPGALVQTRGQVEVGRSAAFEPIAKEPLARPLRGNFLRGFQGLQNGAWVPNLPWLDGRHGRLFR